MAAACVHLCRNRWTEIPIEGILTVCFVPPAMVFAAVGLAFAWRSAWLRQIGFLGLATLVFVGAFWVSPPLRAAVAGYDQKKARDFCAFLVPTLERYRAEHREYPEDIIQMVSEQGGGKPPKLIENGFQYQRRNGTFTLAFIAPQQPFTWHVYDSKMDAWSLEAD